VPLSPQQTLLQGLQTRVNANTLTAADQTAISNALTTCIGLWNDVPGSGTPATTPGESIGLSSAWLAVLYAIAVGGD
jgi:hypothetical protein